MPTPQPLECSVSSCEYQTPTGCPTWDLMVTLLTQHTASVHGSSSSVATQNSKLEKLPRPTFNLNMTESQWNFTKIQWEHYINQVQAPEATILTQLQAACSEPLRQRIFDTGLYHTLNTSELFLRQMETLAVVKVHKSVHLRNLWRMNQQAGETIRAFVARLTATADMCGMTVVCECNREVPYRDNVLQQLVIHGMSDNDIRIRVMSRNTSGELTTLDKLINYIQAEEAGRDESNDLTSEDGQIASMRRKSSYQADKGRCGHCGQKRHTAVNSPEDRKSSCKAYGVTCSKCQRKHHYASVCRSRNKISAIVEPDNTSEAEVSQIATFFSLSSESATPSIEDLSAVVCQLKETSHGPVTTLPLPHHVHDMIHGWLQRKPHSSPTILAKFSVDRKAYSELTLPLPKFKSGKTPGRSDAKPSVCDTGAQLTVLPRSLIADMHVKQESIFPVQTQIHGVANSPIHVDGGLLVTVSATNPDTGITRHSRQLAYVSASVKMPYLSLQACKDLGLVPEEFPKVASIDENVPAMLDVISPTKCSNSGVPSSQADVCQCPKRELPPPAPTVLPYAPTKDNLPRLKQFILDRYASSAFNCCEHQPLRLMDKAPPLRIYTDENARPKAIHTPSIVPLHWKNAVKEGLDRDERLGVIERVPVNSPVGWCSRMVVTSKADGSPRRVVDFTELNKHTPRQTHHTASPWTIVSSIPPNKVKSVVDCWHGYHSVPLHPADKHYTTFVTEWGRYRYRTVPQGLISAGDAYTQRKAELMANITDQATCVDDTIMYDDSIEENFFKVCNFLYIGASGGCTFNPKKFQFGQTEVNFLGFLITADGVQTTKQFQESILNFPTPKNITDVRSWFGCVNQVSYSFAAAPIMEPFRHLLSSKVPFEWSTALQEAFEASKREVLAQCEKGVRSFNPALPTALATDWAKLGVGFWLTQKHCSCPTDPKPTPGCCPTGWQTVYCGSKFCSPAESRYHPIEGEALAATYGLHKCKFFVLGLNNLILTIDHKPLIPIFGKDQQLEDIENPRILNFKLKSLMFRFTVTHVPGKRNVTADTFSRRYDAPSNRPGGTDSTKSNEESLSPTPEYSSKLAPPHWVSPPVSVGSTASFSHMSSQENPKLPTTAVRSLPASLAALHAAPETCEEQLAPEHMFVGSILSTIATINSWYRSAAILSPSHPEALSWQKLESACLSCDVYKNLRRTIETGSDKKEDWDHTIAEFYPMRQSLVVVGPVILLHDRPVIPLALRETVLQHLHSGHQGANSMFERASSSLYWPNYRADIVNFRAACSSCSRYQPSNPAMPPVYPEAPVYPFQSICADFFTVNSANFLAIVDRFSNWLSVFQLSKDTSECLLTVLRNYFATFGIPITFTSDGAKIFTSKLVEDFFNRYGVVHRVTTAYNPKSNKRAEIAVKSAKRMIRTNLSQSGSLDTDKMTRALLQHRNTPCALTGLSPAQILFGRVLRDFLPLQPGKFIPRKEWRMAADSRAAAYSKRVMDKAITLTNHSKALSPLSLGQEVLVQDQNKASRTHKQWTRTGIIVHVGKYDDYQVRLHGSRVLTKRHRQFLRPIKPSLDVFQPTPAPSIPPSHSVHPKPQPQEVTHNISTPEDQTPPPIQAEDPLNSDSDKPLPPVPSLKLRRLPDNSWIRVDDEPHTPNH